MTQNKQHELPICIRMNVYCDIDGVRDSIFNSIQDALADFGLAKTMTKKQWDSMLNYIETEWQGDFRINLPVIVEDDGEGGIEVSFDPGNWAGEVLDYDR